jgi:hypothetical protein
MVSPMDRAFGELILGVPISCKMEISGRFDVERDAF